MHREVGHPISAAKLDEATKAAVMACDPEDGVIDGVINDPRKCKYDPETLICNDKSDPNTCLTTREANAIRKIWEGPKSAKTGEQLWFGFERGSRISTFAQPYGNPVDYFKYWIRRDAGFDWRTVDAEKLEEDIRDSYLKFNRVIGTDDPDLQRWKEHGGRLMMWHDESDEGVPPRGTLSYFDRVLAANNGSDEVDRFARLYMVPGSSHCGTNDQVPLPNGMFNALVDWVENGVVPHKIIASQRLPSGAMRTRPLCPYPKTAQWTRQGSSDDAENFTCVSDTHNAMVISAFDEK
jgi:hypothetical protein